VLNDVLDFPRSHRLTDCRRLYREATAQTEIPSPFAASLLFDFIAVYMYEWDQPREDKYSQYLAVNRELLSEVVDLDTVASLLRPEAITAVEADLQHTRAGYRARTPEELMELLIRVGDLSDDEVESRVEGASREMLSALSRNGRAIMVERGRRTVWIAGEDQTLYARLGSEAETAKILRRYVEHHGPVTPMELADRYGLSEDHVQRVTSHWSSDRHMVRGRFRPPSMPGSDQAQWCYRPNIERIHRQTISILRKEIQPCTLPEYLRFALAWHTQDNQRVPAGQIDLSPCLDQLAGLSLPAEVWEHHIVAARTSGPVTSHVAALGAAQGYVWCGAGPGRMRVFGRGEGNVFLDPVDTNALPDRGEGGRRVLEYLRQHGASFLSDIAQAHLSNRSMPPWGTLRERPHHHDNLMEPFQLKALSGDEDVLRAGSDRPHRRRRRPCRRPPGNPDSRMAGTLVPSATPGAEDLRPASVFIRWIACCSGMAFWQESYSGVRISSPGPFWLQSFRGGNCVGR
jgi:ATP-dependent Lhr-like helicase